MKPLHMNRSNPAPQSLSPSSSPSACPADRLHLVPRGPKDLPSKPGSQAEDILAMRCFEPFAFPPRLKSQSLSAQKLRKAEPNAGGSTHVSSKRHVPTASVGEPIKVSRRCTAGSEGCHTWRYDHLHLLSASGQLSTCSKAHYGACTGDPRSRYLLQLFEEFVTKWSNNCVGPKSRFCWNVHDRWNSLARTGRMDACLLPSLTTLDSRFRSCLTSASKQVSRNVTHTSLHRLLIEHVDPISPTSHTHKSHMKLPTFCQLTRFCTGCPPTVEVFSET